MYTGDSGCIVSHLLLPISSIRPSSSLYHFFTFILPLPRAVAVWVFICCCCCFWWPVNRHISLANSPLKLLLSSVDVDSVSADSLVATVGIMTISSWWLCVLSRLKWWTLEASSTSLPLPNDLWVPVIDCCFGVGGDAAGEENDPFINMSFMYPEALSRADKEVLIFSDSAIWMARAASAKRRLVLFKVANAALSVRAADSKASAALSASAISSLCSQ